jgi:hypothetical protein
MNVATQPFEPTALDCRFTNDLKSIRAQLEALRAQSEHFDLELLGYLIDMAIQEAIERSSVGPANCSRDPALLS